MGEPKTLLALDLSSHTGWSIFVDGKLTEFGLIEVEIKDFQPTKQPEKHPSYPSNLFNASSEMAGKIAALVVQKNPDLIAIEQTVLGRQRSVQRWLEWLHYDVLSALMKLKATFVYLDPSEWRKVLEMRLSGDDKKKNRAVSQGKTRGRITKKHLSVRWANETYGLSLKLKDNDIADSIGLGSAVLKRY